VLNVNILARNGTTCEAYQPTVGLTDTQIRNVQRYLDAVRSNLLFAKSVLLVEGDAEEILIPLLVKRWLALDWTRWVSASSIFEAPVLRMSHVYFILLASKSGAPLLRISIKRLSTPRLTPTTRRPPRVLKQRVCVLRPAASPVKPPGHLREQQSFDSRLLCAAYV